MCLEDDCAEKTIADIKSALRRWGDRPAARACYKRLTAFPKQCGSGHCSGVTCIRAATSDAGFTENDEVVELRFISTMSRNRNTPFEFRISVRGFPDIDRFVH